MRRALATGCLLGLVLAGCGQQAETTVPSTDPSSAESGGAGASDVVVLLHATAVGGTVGDPVPVGTPEQLDAFTAQLTSAAFVREVRRAVTEARSAASADQAVEAAVVALGCDVPEAVTLTADGSVRVPTPKVGTERQCLAPMTTVAVLTVAG